MNIYCIYKKKKFFKKGQKCLVVIYTNNKNISQYLIIGQKDFCKMYSSRYSTYVVIREYQFRSLKIYKLFIAMSTYTLMGEASYNNKKIYFEILNLLLYIQ